MSQITGIEFQKKNKNRVNLYVDGEYLISLYAELVYKYNLSKGSEIDKEKLADIIKSDDYEKAKIKALDGLSRAEKSEKRVREKLSREFDEEIVDSVVKFLKKHSFINDERFAERIVYNDQNFKRVGRNRIKQNLYIKGINSENIENALSNVDNEMEKENAVFLANKRIGRIKGKDEKNIKNKLYQYLIYKGFEYEVIMYAIEKVLGGE
ncbi:recombination regulator RecX [Peptostreptococcus canis]|uniref:Regulatory protein RecX n=1 Tax=Peptostreptococcus canis TaxID=1159213 RepID=A0ABR6TKY6_9FIRM|nr:recombination regulator RecX [Peptostreptococcus canis]MBC2576073.1 recombination regulator RecX [Peptostreptococcus canis]MBP1997801.1 regulatory protein [Peptostreptococcus canis]